jgi:hypothetical protein
MYYKDGTTLVAQLKKKSSATQASTEFTPEAGLQGNQREDTSGWTPINNPFDRTSSPIDSSPAPRKRRARRTQPQKDQPQIDTSEYANPVVFMQPETPSSPGHLRSAPGDDSVEGLEGFVANQSDDEEDDEGVIQAQYDGPADENQSAQNQQGFTGPRHVSRVPPNSVSQNQGLPNGWTSRIIEERGPNFRRTYYLDHNTQRTTWSDPSSPTFNRSTAFAGPNASAPRYPQDYVWVNDQHVPLAAAGIATSGPGAAYSDLAISNLPADAPLSFGAPTGPTTRRTAAGASSSSARGGSAAAAGARRTTASAPTATVASAARPSRVVKLPIKRRSSPAEEPEEDDDADD